jgi:hypothetical protein
MKWLSATTPRLRSVSITVSPKAPKRDTAAMTAEAMAIP